MNKLKIFGLAFVILVTLSRAANAEAVLLASDDFVGITFWVIAMAMLAATAFFFIERSSVPSAWKTSVTVAGLITGIAFVHYMYMRGVWVQTGNTPTVYRYIDWLITVPLQMIEFYLILSAVRKGSSGIFWRLLIGSLVMIIGGYLGEAEYISKMLGFIIGMAGWILIIFEIFRGESSLKAKTNEHITKAFNSLRLIVLIGWAIYPLGYIFGFITPIIGGGEIDINTLNIVYNLADFINKILFGLIIWNLAYKDSS